MLDRPVLLTGSLEDKIPTLEILMALENMYTQTNSANVSMTS